ncbi:MAG TPA: DNA gyrase modulator, partial [Candidatus Limnocylindrales bacterium]
MRDISRRALDTAAQRGASYADVRVVRRAEESINVKSGRVEGVSFGESEGFGVRVLVDGAAVIDAWVDQGPTTYSASVPLASGSPSI